MTLICFLFRLLGLEALSHGTCSVCLRHRIDDSVNKAISRATDVDLICIDDIGLLPVSADAAEGFYRVVEASYEKRPLAISSNIHPSGFDELMRKTIATATVDRLLHHAHFCQTSGESVRFMHNWTL